MKKMLCVALPLLCSLLLVSGAWADLGLFERDAYIGDWTLTGLGNEELFLSLEDFQDAAGYEVSITFSFRENGEMEMFTLTGGEEPVTYTGSWEVDDYGFIYIDGEPWELYPNGTNHTDTDALEMLMEGEDSDFWMIFERTAPAPTSEPTPPPPTPTPTPTKEPEEPRAAMTGLSFTGSAVVGHVAAAGGISPEDCMVRVTFYIEGNYYMGTVGEIEQDGSFEVEGVGPIRYITVALFNSTGSTKLDAQEIFVAN